MPNGVGASRCLEMNDAFTEALAALDITTVTICQGTTIAMTQLDAISGPLGIKTKRGAGYATAEVGARFWFAPNDWPCDDETLVTRTASSMTAFVRLLRAGEEAQADV